MKHITEFRIKERHPLGEHYFSLVLQHPNTLPSIEAGQFVEVEIRQCREVLLRRPISIHDVDETANTLTLLIQIVGNGTRQLSTLQAGDSLNLIYPLGHGFSLQGKQPLLVGGGAGIAPLLFLGKELRQRGIVPTFLLGGRSAANLVRMEAFEAVGRLCCTTEDGSLGERGFVTQHSVLQDRRFDFIYTCGPRPMMAAVAGYARQTGSPCEVSLENTMACGIGACLCCVEDTRQGHQCVCTAGPVFNIEQLKW